MLGKSLEVSKKRRTFATAYKEQHFISKFKKQRRAFSSVGSEHLPYKQRVGGSNPSTPTIRDCKSKGYSLFSFCKIQKKYFYS